MERVTKGSFPTQVISCPISSSAVTYVKNGALIANSAFQLDENSSLNLTVASRHTSSMHNDTSIVA